MKILFVSRFLPWPENVGIAIRVSSILRALQLIGDVDCVFFGNPNQIERLPEGVIPGVAKVLPIPNLLECPIIGRLFRLIPATNREWWFSYLPGFQHFFPSSKELKIRLSTIDVSSYDLAFL